jgi:hypothetical protein
MTIGPLQQILNELAAANSKIARLEAGRQAPAAPKMLPVKEVAALLNIESDSAIAKLKRHNKIIDNLIVKIGGRYFVDSDKFDAYRKGKKS